MFRCFIMNNAEAYLETCQTFKIQNFSKIVNCFLPLTIFAIFSTLHIRPGSEYTSAIAIVTFHYEKKKIKQKRLYAVHLLLFFSKVLQSLSLSFNLKAFFPIFSILFSEFLEQNCQTKGQQLKLPYMKLFINIFFSSKPKYLFNLLRVFSWPALLLHHCIVQIYAFRNLVYYQFLTLIMGHYFQN